MHNSLNCLLLAVDLLTIYCFLILATFLYSSSLSEIRSDEKVGQNIQIAVEKGLRVFTFKQLHSATGGFGKSNVIGQGAFGLVYRGVLQNGRKVAVKLMDQAGKQGEDEFTAEV